MSNEQFIKDYFQKNPYGELTVTICDFKRKIRSFNGTIVIKERCRSRKSWYRFESNYSYDNISKITVPKTQAEKDLALMKKLKREAQKATFTNHFIRQILGADINKNAVANNITSGSVNDGEIISLDAISRYAPEYVNSFRRALKAKEPFRSPRFDFRGYQGSLHITIMQGEPYGHFDKEYYFTGNGYYYKLINDDKFVGVEKD